MPAALKTKSSIEIFFSYSHKDEELRNELDKHLSVTWRRGVAKNWYDRQIGTGTEWAGQIDAHLNSAQIILLLISSDFLSSDYCYDIEMTRALERHDNGQARVIPIILRDVDWSEAPFCKLQCLPKNGKPVAAWPDRDEPFAEIARSIRAVVDELTGETAADVRTSTGSGLVRGPKSEFPDHLEPQELLSGKPRSFNWARIPSWLYALALGLVALALIVGGSRYGLLKQTSKTGQTSQPSQSPALTSEGSRKADSEKRELLRQKLAFAAGWSVALIGQATQRAGSAIFDRALRDLGFEGIEVRELDQRYVAIEAAARAKTIGYQDFETAKSDLLASVNKRLQALGSQQATPYVGFGHDLCALMLLLRFWEKLQAEGDLLSTVNDRLISLQRSLQEVAIPTSLSEKILSMRSSNLANDTSRRNAAQALDEVLRYFDMQPI